MSLGRQLIECDDSDDYESGAESFSSTMCNVCECSSCPDHHHRATNSLNLQAADQSGSPPAEGPNHGLMYTESVIRAESEMEWRRELYRYHCRQEGRVAQPFEHPPPEDIDASVPGYGAAADGQIDRLSHPPTPSGATPHERFGHPVSWYERLQFQMAGGDLGRMQDASLRAASAELCAQGFQKGKAKDASPRVNSKLTARGRGGSVTSSNGKPRKKQRER